MPSKTTPEKSRQGLLNQNDAIGRGADLPSPPAIHSDAADNNNRTSNDLLQQLKSIEAKSELVRTGLDSYLSALPASLSTTAIGISRFLHGPASEGGATLFCPGDPDVDGVARLGGTHNPKGSQPKTPSHGRHTARACQAGRTTAAVLDESKAIIGFRELGLRTPTIGWVPQDGEAKTIGTVGVEEGQSFLTFWRVGEAEEPPKGQRSSGVKRTRAAEDIVPTVPSSLRVVGRLLLGVQPVVGLAWMDSPVITNAQSNLYGVCTVIRERVLHTIALPKSMVSSFTSSMGVALTPSLCGYIQTRESIRTALWAPGATRLDEVFLIVQLQSGTIKVYRPNLAVAGPPPEASPFDAMGMVLCRTIPVQPSQLLTGASPNGLDDMPIAVGRVGGRPHVVWGTGWSLNMLTLVGDMASVGGVVECDTRQGGSVSRGGVTAVHISEGSGVLVATSGGILRSFNHTSGELSALADPIEGDISMIAPLPRQAHTHCYLLGLPCGRLIHLKKYKTATVESIMELVCLPQITPENGKVTPGATSYAFVRSVFGLGEILGGHGRPLLQAEGGEKGRLVRDVSNVLWAVQPSPTTAEGRSGRFRPSPPLAVGSASDGTAIVFECSI